MPDSGARPGRSRSARRRALPRLRALDFFPVQEGGETLIAVRDAEELADGVMLLPPPVYLVAALLDGRRSAADVQAEYARRSGGALGAADLQRLIDELDRVGLLETDALDARRRAAEEAFRASAVRAARHAGASYPDDPGALRDDLEAYLRGTNAEELQGLSPRGIIAPHIDFPRGGWCYGWAYAALRASRATTFVVLGVAHSAPPAPVVVTEKSFATPLGTVAVDRGLVRALWERTGDLTAHEIVHRTEHSLEFQVVFLQAALSGRPFTILPILCSSFEAWAGVGSPRDAEELERVVSSLREVVRARPDVGVVVGVDFSHVGPRFGDADPVDDALASRTSLADRAVLDAIVRGDPDLFWRTVAAGGNPRRIDALSAVYTALRVLEPAAGRLLRYGQALDPSGGIVSFASFALIERPGGPERSRYASEAIPSQTRSSPART
jgi:AmmeMemoRadiSam system protein B